MTRCLKKFACGCFFTLLFLPAGSFAGSIPQPENVGAEITGELGSPLMAKSPLHVAESLPPEIRPPALSPAPLQAPRSTPAKFNVHEWGLVIYSKGSVEISTSGHGAHPEIPAPTMMMNVGKPLIYLHPEADFDFDTSISLSVTLQGEENRLREVWPTPWAKQQPLHGNRYTWPQIKLMKNQRCGRELAPALSSLSCKSLTDGGVCEAHEMSLYLGTVTHCLKSVEDALLTPVLLYNAALSGQKVPLSVTTNTRRPEESEVKNLSKHPLGPIYLRVGEKIWRLKSLEPGAVTKAGAGEYLGDRKDSIQSSIRKDLKAQGLTDQEAEDFINAWSPNVLKAPYQWEAFGFLSTAGLDAISTLEIWPEPSSIKRVMGFAIQ